MKQLFYLNVLLLLVFQFACKEKPSNNYENCCGTLPTTEAFLIKQDTFDGAGNLIDSVYTAHLYVPNIFIPDNNNGINTAFEVIIGPGVERIISLVLSDENGNVLFQEEDFLPDANNFAAGWNGKKSDGSYYYGSFNYEMKVRFLDGQTKTYINKACSVHCGDSDFPTNRLPDCFFPSQNNGNGEPDQHYPASIDCF